MNEKQAHRFPTLRRFANKYIVNRKSKTSSRLESDSPCHVYLNMYQMDRSEHNSPCRHNSPCKHALRRHSCLADQPPSTSVIMRQPYDAHDRPRTLERRPKPIQQPRRMANSTCDLTSCGTGEEIRYSSAPNFVKHDDVSEEDMFKSIQKCQIWLTKHCTE